MSSVGWVAVGLATYAGIVLALGLFASRRAGKSPEDYFLAGRQLGPLVLFMALFGTNCTPFVLIGVPGRAYHEGIGIFGVNAPIIALGIPLTFWLVGSPARRMGLRLGAMTPAELYARRFQSRAVGALLFLVFSAYTLPYMVIGLKGAATALNGATEGALPPWLGALGVVLLTGVYTAAGGMRATAWTNVLQGLVFLLFMLACFVLIPLSLGGLSEATAAVRAHEPDLLRVMDGPLFGPRAWASWGLVISLTVIAFPHMFARLMAARDEGAIRSSCRWYPLALVLLWVPAVLLGVWGAAAFPGLEGRESDRIFSLMTSTHLPSWLGPLGAVAVLASVMSTLDAQLLTLSSMLVRDVLDPATAAASADEEQRAEVAAKRDVRASRLFGLGLGVVVYVLALTWGQSLFGIAEIAFSGYVTLAPALFLGVTWRRCTAAGAIASVVAGNVALGLGLAGLLPTAGFLPVFWAFVCAVLAGVLVSWATRPQEPAALERAFGLPIRTGAKSS